MGGFSSSSCTPCVGSTVAAAALSPSKKFPGATANVFDAVEHIVTWGLEHRTLGQIDAIGVDEIQYSKGHKYLTLVYQIDLGVTRLLWIGKEGTIESFQGFFTTMGEEITSKIVFICSDMWEPYLKVIREKCSEALHILDILDRFHIVAKMNKALDEVQARESRRMASEGRTPLLKKSRWLLLKREENLKAEQRFRSPPLQLEDRPGLPSQGSIPATLGAPGTDPQLLPGAKNDFQRGRGGLEQQGQSHPEKILWLSYLPGARTLPISLAWQAA